jgi:hypothetical protein
VDDIDPKSFIAKTHRFVASVREVEVSFEHAGFTDINLVHLDRAEDPYWMLYASARGNQEQVEGRAREVLAEIGLNAIEFKGAPNHLYWTSYIAIPSEQIEYDEVAESIVRGLLEDIDADLPSHKSEVRILPTDNPARFDVTLLTGFDPIYIGTIVNQGRSWKPVEVMPGVGRQLRTRLHLVGPDKESLAMTMVEILRPIWKRKVTQHLLNQMESEEVDPKAFVQQKTGYDVDIRRVIESNYPDVEILNIQAETGYKLRYVVTIRSKDPAKPLWHQPVYNMIGDLQKKLWNAYGWRMRPYAHQERYPASNRIDGVCGIRPISICYDTATGQPGVINLLIDFDILKKDDHGGYNEEPNWNTPYESLDPKQFVVNNRIVSHVRNLRDLQRFPDDQVFLCNDPTLMRDYGVAEPIRCSKVYWKGGGVVSLEFTGFDGGPRISFAPITSLTPVMEDLAADISKEAAKAEKPESPEQAEAGNYRKGHVCVQGFQIAIENAKGSTRSGTNKNGTPWKVTMPAHYGYIKGTEGKDKDHLDVYIGPKPDGYMVYVVNQRTFEGAFDEHKIMLGFHSKAEAIETYDRAFTGSLGPRLRASVVSTTVDRFKEWIKSGNHKVPFEGLAESLLEDEGGEEYGWDALKALVMRAAEPLRPGTTFHIGFAVHTSDQHMIEARANDDAIEVNWDAVNEAIPIIERNAVKALGEQGIKCSPEGHDSYGDLVGSAWVEAGTGGIEIVKTFIQAGEPFSTGSGSINNIQSNLSLALYQGVPDDIAALIDVDISFFDVNNEDFGIEESDIKSLAMRAPMRDPQTWGELQKGDVVFVPETGSFQRIEGFKDGYGVSYQDTTGRLVYASGPARMVLYTEFGPSYAYGHFPQRLTHHPKGGLLGAHLVDVDNTSDEALWKLVDEEMYRNGTSPEELEQDRAAHRARQAARRPEEVDAQRRYDELMGRVPEPPIGESEGDIDPKAFLSSHELPVTLVPIHDNAWMVHRTADDMVLGQIHFDLHDDAPTPEARANWADTNWIATPLTPSVQPQAFKDQDEALQFLLQHGNR